MSLLTWMGVTCKRPYNSTRTRGNQMELHNTNNKPTKNLATRQVLLPGLFNKQRSNSLSELPTASQYISNAPSASTSEKSSDISSNPMDVQTPNQQHPSWQRVPSTKKRKVSQLSPSQEPIITQNRFNNLPVDHTDAISQPTPTYRPPPIILYGIEDLNELTKVLETVISPANFKYKIVNKNNLRIMVDTADDYKEVINLIREKGLIGHTFTRKEVKPYRIVIRNLHHTTPHESITREIEKTGNKVQGEIINSRYGPDKKPTSTFFVNLEPCINNKLVKEIKYIHHQAIKIEDPRKRKTIVQCHRCQQYGHCKNNCMRPYRCVKCGEGHKTSDCPKKDRNTPAKCALCFCDHPANYKGCQVYKEIASRKLNHSKTTAQGNDAKHNTTQAPGKPPQDRSRTNLQHRSQQSYADVAAGNPFNTNVTLDVRNVTQQSSLEQLLVKQNEKIDHLLQQISTLMGLLTTVINKLT